MTITTTGSALSAACLFSGMGGLASSLKNGGFELAWASDNDPYACLTFRHRFPNVNLIEKDVRALSVRQNNLSPVDVLAAGFPCQSFSQAGDRKGFADPRGRLFFEIPRLLKEIPPPKRPRLLILENVSHLLHGANGTWFDRVQRELRQAGYWFRKESCWIANVKDATDIPQDRERLFLLAASREHFGYNPFTDSPDTKAPNRKKLDDLINRQVKAPAEEYLAEDNRYFKMIEEKISTGQSSRNIYQLRRSYVREKRDGLCPTLTANMGIGGHNVPFIKDDWGIRRLSIEEVARFQGFTETGNLFPTIPSMEKYRLLGNAVCTKLGYVVSQDCVRILRGASK